FRQQNGARYLTFQEDATGRVRFMDRSMERIAWYQSGHAAIIGYFGFLILSIPVLFLCRHDPNARPLRWMAWAVLLHSVMWLGAVLAADPQRLILGLPWYLIGALAFGAAVPLVWIYLAAATARAVVAGNSPARVRLVSVLLTGIFALYVPFIFYWRLTILS